MDDLSPPRKGATAKRGPPDEAAAPAAKRPQTMADGTRIGLVSGGDLKSEMAAKRARDARDFAARSDAEIGRGAKTVYRDKAGKQITEEEYQEVCMHEHLSVMMHSDIANGLW